jgi:hypothetical protein
MLSKQHIGGSNFIYGVFGSLTKPKYQEPRSKVRLAKKNSASVETTIPEKIAHAMRLKAGDSIEWIWITQGLESYCKVTLLRE